MQHQAKLDNTNNVQCSKVGVWLTYQYQVKGNNEIIGILMEQKHTVIIELKSEINTTYSKYNSLYLWNKNIYNTIKHHPSSSSEATPWLLQPHQGNMSRSWLRDTDSQNGDALLCIYYINFMYSE